jgi:hypothetical protein
MMNKGRCVPWLSSFVSRDRLPPVAANCTVGEGGGEVRQSHGDVEQPSVAVKARREKVVRLLVFLFCWESVRRVQTRSLSQEEKSFQHSGIKQ